MWEWISGHQAVLSVLINAGTLLIWLVYAQLLYNGYKRQRRPRVVINRGKSAGTDALCIKGLLTLRQATAPEFIFSTQRVTGGAV